MSPYFVDRKNGFGHRRRCNDCRRDVVRMGHWYMASPTLWGKQLGLGWDDNLCLDCLEKRLGRKLRPGIFGSDVSPSSTPCKFPLAERLIDLWSTNLSSAKPKRAKRKKQR
jgi:hypothetical protein